jgi:hypothetical protein
MGCSRLTKLPRFNVLKLVHARVSGETSTVKAPGNFFTTVKHVPLTATLAPMIILRTDNLVCTVSTAEPLRKRNAAILPTSSINPVNIG